MHNTHTRHPVEFCRCPSKTKTKNRKRTRNACLPHMQKFYTQTTITHILVKMISMFEVNKREYMQFFICKELSVCAVEYKKNAIVFFFGSRLPIVHVDVKRRLCEQ